MKRIGILTFHKSINFGAFVQCYALSKRIQKDFPDCKVEVIDYCTDFANKLYDPIFSLYNSAKKLPFLKRMALMLIYLIRGRFSEFIVKKRGFDRAYKYLPLSDFSLITDNEKDFFEKIKGKYDVIVAGSDCIWDFIAYPFPNAYYLNSDVGAKKLSFAATTNRMKYENLSDFEKEYMVEAFKDFSYLGVRDHFCQDLLKELSPDLETHITLDPSLLLDIDSLDVDLSALKSRMEEGGIDFSKPIIGVMGPSIGKMVRSIFGKDYQIVALYENFKEADYFLNGVTPLEWAKAFSLFSITFTRFFHGMLLSLKNLTPVMVFDDWKARFPYMKSKIEDMLENLDLKEFHFISKPDFSEEEKEMIKKQALAFMEKPDKEKIANAILKSEKGYLDFKIALEKALND